MPTDPTYASLTSVSISAAQEEIDKAINNSPNRPQLVNDLRNAALSLSGNAGIMASHGVIATVRAHLEAHLLAAGGWFGGRPNKETILRHTYADAILEAEADRAGKPIRTLLVHRPGTFQGWIWSTPEQVTVVLVTPPPGRAPGGNSPPADEPLQMIGHATEVDTVVNGAPGLGLVATGRPDLQAGPTPPGIKQARMRRVT